jgi:hypothetical protein
MTKISEIEDFVVITVPISPPKLYPVFVPIEALAIGAKALIAFPEYQIFAYLQSGEWVSICALGQTEVVVEKNGRLL